VAKTKNFPFLLAPRLKPVPCVVGDPEGQTLVIERRGYLTVAEKSFVTMALNGEEAIGGVRRLAVKIARETGKSQAEVLEDLSGDVSKLKYIEPYVDELDECYTQMSVYQHKMMIVTATALITNRLDAEWTVEDTMSKLDPEILKGLQDLYTDEEAKNIEALKEEYNLKDDENAKKNQMSPKEEIKD
jgi:hypothetical protein